MGIFFFWGGVLGNGNAMGLGVGGSPFSMVMSVVK